MVMVSLALKEFNENYRLDHLTDYLKTDITLNHRAIIGTHYLLL